MKKFLIFITAIFLSVPLYAINLYYMNEDDTVYENTTCTVGDDLILPTPPTKRGYTFAGWSVPNVQRIEYLESTGTQYIDTGFYPNQDSGVKTKIEFSTICTFCGISFGSDQKYEYYSMQNIEINYDSQTSNKRKEINKGDIIEINWNKNIFNFTFNGEYQEAIDFNYKIFSTSSHLTIFALNRSNSTSYRGQIRVYYFQIYDNDILVRDFIPVIKDGMPCMYDKVEGKFYYNAGTGNFIAGPVIVE